MKGNDVPRNKEANEQMRAQSREQILTTARRLFAERGYFNCKVSDIASEAGMSQGNLYWYFSSKEEVLKAVLADGFETLGKLMEDVLARPGTSIEKLDTLLREYLVFGRERGEFVAIFMSLMAHGGVPLMHELGFDTVQIGMRYHQSLSIILAQGQSERTIIADIDPNLLAMFFFAFFNGLMVTYGKDWTSVPIELIQQAAFRLLGGYVSK
jgi:AcrR family transcriptional regulator